MIFKCLLGVFLLAVTIEYSAACSCLKQHPQTAFCEAEFVMQLSVRTKPEIIYSKTEYVDADNKTKIYRQPIQRRYTVDIRKVFKVKNNSLGLTDQSKKADLYTSYHESSCGIELLQRTKYLVAGRIGDNGLSVHLCNMVQRWSWVSRTQKKGLHFRYEPNCNCEINDSWLNEESTDKYTCNWDWSQDKLNCYTRHSACVYNKNNVTGGCKWHKNPDFKQCKHETKHGKALP